jgi:hypothetical protein
MTITGCSGLNYKAAASSKLQAERHKPKAESKYTPAPQGESRKGRRQRAKDLVAAAW